MPDTQPIADTRQIDTDWESVAERVVICVNDYLDFEGHYSIGGRQRYVRDLALLVKDWGREVVVVQKASTAFEKSCPAGITVIGLKAKLTGKGDLFFWKCVESIKKKGDVFLYASGDDVWPFVQPNSKAIQHGIHWDGPQPPVFRWVQSYRAKWMAKNMTSVLCVDTNFINWLRTLDNAGYYLANKCVYIPNYADVSKIPQKHSAEDKPLAIIAARRNSEFRGIDLLMEALVILHNRGINFTAHICTNTGHDELQNQATKQGFGKQLTTSADSMDEVLCRYQNFDVAVVPTKWSEGTSLACVEALAAGLAVVTTPVGGLANLIVPNYNGFVVAPLAPAIAEALENLCDPKTLQPLQKNALSMRNSLDLSNWQKNVLVWLKA